MNKAAGLTIASCALLIGCGDASDLNDSIPDERIVGRIERLLQGRECIGVLGRWERHYTYAPVWTPGAGGRPDRTLVEFTFYESGFDGFHQFRSGRIVEPIENIFHYDGGARVVTGRYDLTANRLTVDYCGSNFPQTAEEKAQMNRLLRGSVPD